MAQTWHAFVLGGLLTALTAACAPAAEAPPAEEEVQAPVARSAYSGPQDMAPLDSRTRYLRTKTELVLLGSSDPGCFGDRLELPEGASVTGFTATVKGGNRSDTPRTDAHLVRRPWSDLPFETLASVEAAPGDYEELVSDAEGLPVTVSPDEHVYVVWVCLDDGGGFLGARVEYELP